MTKSPLLDWYMRKVRTRPRHRVRRVYRLFWRWVNGKPLRRRGRAW